MELIKLYFHHQSRTESGAGFVFTKEKTVNTKSSQVTVVDRPDRAYFPTLIMFWSDYAATREKGEKQLAFHITL